MKKVNVCGRVDIEVLQTFNENIKQLKGKPFGSKGRGLETSMRIMNNYFRIYEDRTLISIAEELNLQPWELGEVIIKQWIEMYRKVHEDN